MVIPFTFIPVASWADSPSVMNRVVTISMNCRIRHVKAEKLLNEVSFGGHQCCLRIITPVTQSVSVQLTEGQAGLPETADTFRKRILEHGAGLVLVLVVLDRLCGWGKTYKV
jgi:hypothetical protein